MIATLAAAAALQQAEIGQLVSFRYNDTTVCARVASVDTSAWQGPRVWVVEVDNPGRTHRVALGELVPGCGERPQARG